MRTIKFQMDGNQVCATWDDFDCLATSPAGFGENIAAASIDLFLNDPNVAKSIPKERKKTVCTHEWVGGMFFNNCKKCGLVDDA